MGSKDPIQVAREILERDLASTTEQEEILESVEEVEEDIEIVEDDLEEMAHGDKKKKSEAMHDDEDEDEDGWDCACGFNNDWNDSTCVLCGAYKN